MTERAPALERIHRLVRAAREIADPASALGRQARRELPASTRLSPAGVELALSECLELRPSASELEHLLLGVRPAAAAHVALPSNVFVAAHRAICLALAESSLVSVRPSRREPVFARLLAEAAPGLFSLVDSLCPGPGDSLWVYGDDDTLAGFRNRLPPAVRLHAEGPGFGVAVIDAPDATLETARRLAEDIVPFDQRGCLSPRLALVRGTPAEARAFGALIARELEAAAERVPLGSLEPAEAAEITRFRDTYRYAAELAAAGPGFVACSGDEHLHPAPCGRNLVVAPCARPEVALAALATRVTAVGVAGDSALSAVLGAALPGARVSPLGRMQRPPLDGPVDRRNRG